MADTGRRLRVAYAAVADPRSIRSWSGTHYHMGQALEKYGCEVIYIGPIPNRYETAGKAIRKLTALVTKKGYNYHWGLLSSLSAARYVDNALKNIECDAIFLPEGARILSFLRTPIPRIYLHDATAKLMTEYYPSMTNLTGFCRAEIETVERRAIRKADLLIFPSEWAAQSAIHDYHADPSRVHMVNFGANMEGQVPPFERAVHKKRGDVCRLLFVGVIWERKGGSIAFDTLKALVARGVNAELVICGCTPPPGFEHPNVTVIPFLNKKVEAERQRMAELYLESDFFVMPTRAEAAAISLCEASAYGLPILTTETGGLASIVLNGENGYRLPFEAGGDAYADLIQEIYQDEARYNALRRSTRRMYEERLNWDVWGSSVSSLIREMIRSRTKRETLPAIRRATAK